MFCLFVSSFFDLSLSLLGVIGRGGRFVVEEGGDG